MEDSLIVTNLQCRVVTWKTFLFCSLVLGRLRINQILDFCLKATITF